MNPFAEILRSRTRLNFDESYKMQQAILTGGIGTDELVEIFGLMDGRYPTGEEMNGIIAATRDSMTQVKVGTDALDIVGTGGDGMQTFNISTTAAVVCAACGIPVVKHGNRSASSRCGSADVLEALGVNITLDAERALSCFEKTGMAFLFAPVFHPALKNAATARKQFGKRTYFNILGPLVNPANISHLTLGVYDKNIISLMGKASLQNGVKHIWIVNSPDGLDELSPFVKTGIAYFSAASPEGRILSPEYKLQDGSVKDIQATDAEESARLMMDVLRNKSSEVQKQTVIINAAAGIMTFGKTANFSEAAAIAAEAIESGKALQKFERIREVTNG